MFRKVACAISGGVDSAVAALLLKRKGFEVTGIYMRNWDHRDEGGTCVSVENDLADAKSVCSLLGIKFLEVSFVKEYWNDVFTMVLEDYQNGMTPNPDIFCNRYVKFGALFRYVRDQLGYDAIATGHYARNSFGTYLEAYNPEEKARLLKGIDYKKDQTLFLSQIKQEALRRTMFPLGNLFKTQVRNIAKESGMLRVQTKKDSTGICFIGHREFKDFLLEYVPNSKGRFVELDTQKVVGIHNGVHNYTVGERCRIPGHNVKYYVASRDAASQDIFVVNDVCHPALYGDYIMTGTPHWISGEPVSDKTSYTCLFRFQHGDGCVPCELFFRHDGLEVRLGFPLRALTPGQIAVFYKGDQCLGGAKILQAGWTTAFSSRTIASIR